MGFELQFHSPVPRRYESRRAGPEIVKFGLAWWRGVTVEWALFWIFMAGLAWVPFWYGSNDLLAWGINAILFPGLTLIFEFSILLRGESHPVGVRQIWIPAALFVATVVWIQFQNATWTPSFLHHPIWAMTADALDKPIAGSISVNRDLTALALVRLVTAASVFWIALQLCRDKSRANYCIIAIALIVAGYAAYGLIIFVMMPDTVHLSHGFVTSTFINRNNFATYAGMGLIATCGLILRLYGRKVATSGGSIGFRIASIIEVTGQEGAIFIGGAFLILVALLLTGSRGGFIATGLGLLALGVLLFGARTVDFTGRREILVVGTLFIAAVFLTFGDTVLGHISETGITDENRLAFYLIVLRSIYNAPLLGYGYGTFIDVFPMFRDHSITAQGLYEFAHNTYLEVFQGLGMVFGAALVASVVLLVSRSLNGAMARQEGKMAPRVATCVAMLVGVHAMVDYSLQIQAVTLTFMALLGAGVAQSKSSRLVLNEGSGTTFQGSG